MATASIRERLAKLEDTRRFLDWFAQSRFYQSLTDDEIRAYVREGQLPDPLPSRPSKLDSMDRESLLKRWKENEWTFGGRSHEELEFYAENGFWPEARGRFHYSIQDGKLLVEWRNGPVEGCTGPKPMTEEQGT
jgi:hypothetical protein